MICSCDNSIAGRKFSREDHMPITSRFQHYHMRLGFNSGSFSLKVVTSKTSAMVSRQCPQGYTMTYYTQFDPSKSSVPRGFTVHIVAARHCSPALVVGQLLQQLCQTTIFRKLARHLTWALGPAPLAHMTLQLAITLLVLREQKLMYLSMPMN